MPRPQRLVWRSELGWSSRSPAAFADPKRGLVIHYDGSNQRLADKPHSACLDYWRATRRFHTNGRGWADIGYSFGACPHGYVLEGRGIYRTQAAQPGGNTTYYSCTLMGGPTDEITPLQIEAVRQLRAWLMEPDTSIAGTVKGHRDFISTSCPGDKAYRMVRDGVFGREPGSVIDIPGGGANGEGDEMSLINLKVGDGPDNGLKEHVIALQSMIVKAGRGDALGDAGVDGRYGDATAEGLRLCRADVGSAAEEGWGDRVSGHAFSQLLQAMGRQEFREMAGELSSSGSGGGSAEIPQDLTVRSLTAQRISVG